MHCGTQALGRGYPIVLTQNPKMIEDERTRLCDTMLSGSQDYEKWDTAVACGPFSRIVGCLSLRL